jgi:hypothetical protein
MRGFERGSERRTVATLSWCRLMFPQGTLKVRSHVPFVVSTRGRNPHEEVGVVPKHNGVVPLPIVGRG